MRIRPKIHPLIQEALDQRIIGCVQTHPTHIVFPQILQERIEQLGKRDGVALYVAHKATQSRALIKQAITSGCGIDVSSLQELLHALNAGCTPQHLCCSGPKNNEFITHALHHHCLISVDSTQELQRIAHRNTPAQILVRIADPPIGQREVLQKKTRFGVCTDEMAVVWQTLAHHPHITLKGFHIHHDGYSIDMKAAMIESLLTFITQARARGHSAQIINIGGSLPATTLENRNEWLSYVQTLQDHIIKGTRPPTWDASAYGMYRQNNGVVGGRLNAELREPLYDAPDYIEQLLSHPTSSGVSISQLCQECGVQLIMEPGKAVCSSSGCTVLPVIETKQMHQDAIVIVQANMFTIGARMFDQIADPLLITADNQERKDTAHTQDTTHIQDTAHTQDTTHIQDNQTDSSHPVNVYIMGNLCREDDILIKRSVHLPIRPQSGDVLVLCNTGAYMQHYEQANPQMHQHAHHSVAIKKQQWYVGDDQ